MVNICGACEQKIGKNTYSIGCRGDCQRWFHITCTSLNKEEVKDKKSKDFIWYCKDCKRQSRKHFSSFESAKSLSSSSGEEEIEERTSFYKQGNGRKTIYSLNGEQNKNKYKQQLRVGADIDQRKNKDISNLEVLQTLTRRLDSMEESMDFSNKIVEDLKNTLKEEIKQNKKIRREHEELKQRVSVLENEIARFKKYEDVKQRGCNVIIIGLNNDGDTLKNDVKKVLTTIGVNASEKDYQVKPVPSQSNNKPVLVTFDSPEIKGKVIENRKKLQNVSSTNIGLRGPERNIYINEDLTKEVRMLFNKARELKKHNYKYIWCKYNKVYCRESDESETVKITSISQVETLLNKK